MILTRRAAIALPWLAGSARTATAQPVPSQSARPHPAPSHPLGTTIFAADSQPSSVLLAQALAAQLGGDDFQAEASQDVAHGVTALANRDQNNLAILPSAVLASMDRRGLSITDSMRFIARVCVIDIHVLAAERINSVAELAGQKINMGPLGSQGQVTASLLLERAGLRVEPVYGSDDAALASLTGANLRL